MTGVDVRGSCVGSVRPGCISATVRLIVALSHGKILWLRFNRLEGRNMALGSVKWFPRKRRANA